MGYHYVPQRYLRNFEARDKPGFIWLHDKRGGSPRLARIAKVMQTKGFYSEDVELFLARAVEAPANAVIEKLLANEALDSEDRRRLAYYLGTMLKRIPYRRRKFLEMIPDVLEGTVAGLRSQVTALAEAAGTDSSLVKRVLEDLEAARQKYARQPPPEVIEQARLPWPSSGMLDALYRMTWRVLISSGPQYFITTDNPAFFFEAYGLANENAELAFPLSLTHCLHASWQRQAPDLIFLRPPQRIVKEINRRLASAAERLAFYHEPASWLQVILPKKNQYLSVIRWS